MGYKRGKSWYSDFWYRRRRYTKSWGRVSPSRFKELDRKFRVEVAEGEYEKKRDDITLNQLSEIYLDWSKNNKKENSYLRDITSLNRLCPPFGTKKLSQITSFMIERYKSDRKNTGVKPGTINRELACLKAMLNKAIDWEMLKDNPCRLVKFFRENNERMMILSGEQEAAMMSEIQGARKASHLEAIVVTALNTGLRRRELLDLTWRQVNFKEGYLLITNTKNSEPRMIPMNRVLTAVLRQLRKDRGRDGIYVFPNKDGVPYRDVKTAYNRICRVIGITEFRFHDLRHTFASRLVMKGVDLATVKELMGHKDIKMTLRYSHPTPEHKKRAVEVLDDEVPSEVTTPQNEEESGNIVNIQKH